MTVTFNILEVVVTLISIFTMYKMFSDVTFNRTSDFVALFIALGIFYLAFVGAGTF